MNYLEPIQCVKCPVLKDYIDIKECKTCCYKIEIRQPYRHWAVKCSYVDPVEESMKPEPSIDQEYRMSW